MRKAKTLRFIGIFLGAWGFGILIHLLRQIPFDFLDPAYGGLVILTVALLLGGGSALYMVKKLKNQNSNVETDEMFKKVGYTSLAASFEFLMGIMLLASLLDGYFHFLEMLSVHDTLRIIWIIGLILLGLTSRYYSHNPDKTGL